MEAENTVVIVVYTQYNTVLPVVFLNYIANIVKNAIVVKT